MKPTRLMRLTLSIVSLALAAALLVLFSVGSQSSAASPAAPSATGTPAATPAPTEVPAAEPTAPPAADEPATDEPEAANPLPGAVSSLSLDELEDYNGIPVGFTDEGLPFMGDPAAPVAMVEFSDYLCPFCGRHFQETVPVLIDEYVLTGKLRMVFQDFPIPSLHPTAQQGHVAARCVGEQGAATYWAMHDQLFGRQDEWNRLADPAEFLLDAAEQSGADLTLYQECLDEGRGEAPVADGMADGNARGFNGTPTFVFASETLTDSYSLIGAYPADSFRLWIDTMLEGEAPPVEAEPEPPALPPWANEEGLAADPQRPGYNLYGDPYKGSDDAPLTIIEYSDFQCPACARHNNDVQGAIDEAFVETGKIRWVFKHRPLSIHPLAPVAAVAAECAADQGLFWEMHDELFAQGAEWAPEDENWTIDDAEVALVDLAKELGLEADTFVQCLNSREALERVLYDIYDSEGIVSATPTFIVLYGGQGTLLNGSRGVEEFTQILTEFVELAEEAAAQESE